MALQAQTHQFLNRANVSYLKSQIEAGHPGRAKKALQEICALHRGGIFVKPDQRLALEHSILGLFYSQRNDEKVRRWALNALARMGKESTSLEAVKHVLADFRHEPQTIAAAIAALYKLSKSAPHVLKTLDFDPQMTALAALQHISAKDLDLSALPLNVDTASADLLKLALVVVGLDRSPTNLLNPRHSNAEMVKALGGHHDNTVSQYTVWAITENPSLGIANLGIDIRGIEQQPANVRAWLFQLLAMTPTDAAKYQEYLVLGTNDPDAEARIGLAGGLKNTYFDGLEVVVLDWFVQEGDIDVSQVLMDHMIRQSRHSVDYENLVLDFYEKEPSGSTTRQRMEARAAGTPLYAKMRKIDARSRNDFFNGDIFVTNNFNVNGGIQAGAVSLGGNAENSGAVSVHYNPQTVELIQSELAKAERVLHSTPIANDDLKREALAHVQAAKADPSPDKLSKVVTILGKVESLVTKGVAVGTAIGTIGTALGKVAGLI